MDIVFIVMNDKGHSVIKHIQDILYGGRHYFGDLLGPDLEIYSKVAEIEYIKVKQENAFGDTIWDALKLTGLSIVEVGMKVIGDFPRYFKVPLYAEKEGN